MLARAESRVVGERIFVRTAGMFVALRTRVCKRRFTRCCLRKLFSSPLVMCTRGVLCMQPYCALRTARQCLTSTNSMDRQVAAAMS